MQRRGVPFNDSPELGREKKDLSMHSPSALHKESGEIPVK